MIVSSRILLLIVAVVLLTVATGCSDRDPAGLEKARANIDPVVFDNELSDDAYFQAFSGTHYLAVTPDSTHAYGDGYAPDGDRSLKITVPARGSALGAYAGGVITSSGARDMADFNALTFYARADEPMLLNVAGFGNDNTGTSRYEAGRGNISVGTDWTFVVIPIPDSSKLIAERGLFTFAEGWEDSFAAARDFWVDEIKYAQLGNVSIKRPAMTSGTSPYFVGSTASMGGTSTIFDIDGGFVPVAHSANYFNFVSSDASVATVSDGTITVIGEGSATIEATLQDVPVAGRVTVTGYLPPTSAAPSPDLPASQVISLFGDAYTAINVDDWNADWGMPVTVADYAVGGTTTKMYTTLQWAGIIVKSPMLDTSGMTHFHLDVYAPDGTDFKVKLVSFPTAGGKVERELRFAADTTPPFNAGTWSALEIPLADFGFPENWDAAHIGELVISTTDARLVLVDNVYFHN